MGWAKDATAQSDNITVSFSFMLLSYYDPTEAVFAFAVSRYALAEKGFCCGSVVESFSRVRVKDKRKRVRAFLHKMIDPAVPGCVAGREVDRNVSGQCADENGIVSF